MIVPRTMLFLGLAASLLLAGCNAWQDRAEFAPPESRWPTQSPYAVWPFGGPSDTGINAPPPAVRAVHCYRTLASVDCFPEKQPDRYSTYTGTYPGD